MRKELQYIEQIERYLLGEMNSDEKQLFENKMKVDNELASAFLLQKELIERIQTNKFKTAVAQYDKAYLAPTNKNDGRTGKLLWIALIGLLSIGIGGLTWYSLTNNNAQDEIISETIEEKTVIKDEVNPIIVEDTTATVSIDSLYENLVDKTPNEEEKNKSFSIPEHLTLPFVIDFIDNNRNDTLILNKSGSKIYFTEKSVVDKNGNTIDGDIEIRYREYRNKAEIAFSDITMDYIDNGDSAYFNSAGMFEIRAYKNGAEVFLNPEKPMQIDYELTEPLEDLSFYVKNQPQDMWEYLEPVVTNIVSPINANQICDSIVTQVPTLKGGFEYLNEFRENHPIYQAAIKYKLNGMVDFYADISEEGNIIGIAPIFPYNDGNLVDSVIYLIYRDLNNWMPGMVGIDSAAMTVKMKYNFVGDIPIKSEKVKVKKRNGKGEDLKLYKAMQKEHDDNMNALRQEITDYLAGEEFINDVKFNLSNSSYINELSYLRNTVSNQYGKILEVGDEFCRQSSIDPSIPVTSRNVVYGLIAYSFGIYNCDQIMRIKNKVEITGRYYNNGESIKPIEVYYLDMTKNTCIKYYHTFPVIINYKNSTVLLILDNDMNLYIINSNDFANKSIIKSGNYEFEVENVTESIKCADDLMNYIKM